MADVQVVKSIPEDATVDEAHENDVRPLGNVLLEVRQRVHHVGVELLGRGHRAEGVFRVTDIVTNYGVMIS
jgi:hypothetical protein